MTDKQTQAHHNESNMEKDPATWVTGDEKMTGAQHSYLKTLSEEAKVDFDETLTKADASLRIDELQGKTGRGSHASAPSQSSLATSQSETADASNPNRGGMPGNDAVGPMDE